MAERADIPDLELEPLLDGNRIMELAKLKPGPTIGKIRDQLLEAQVRDDVSTLEEAERFVLDYVEEHRLY
jgi:poly(A) polymerase